MDILAIKDGDDIVLRIKRADIEAKAKELADYRFDLDYSDIRDSLIMLLNAPSSFSTNETEVEEMVGEMLNLIVDDQIDVEEDEG